MYYVILRIDYKSRLAEIVSSWFNELEATDAFTSEIDKFFKSGHDATLINKHTAVIIKNHVGFLYNSDEIRYIIQLLSFDDCPDCCEPETDKKN